MNCCTFVRLSMKVKAYVLCGGTDRFPGTTGLLHIVYTIIAHSAFTVSFFFYWSGRDKLTYNFTWDTGGILFCLLSIWLDLLDQLPYAGFYSRSRILRKLLDSWKFNSWTATSQVKCIISYWNKEGSSWKFKCELSACNRFVKISHREKYPVYGI